jgi:hypothetical protein
VVRKKQTSSDVEGTRYFVCGEVNDEGSIQCERFKTWSHDGCAELIEEDCYLRDTRNANKWLVTVVHYLPIFPIFRPIVIRLLFYSLHSLCAQYGLWPIK